MSAADQHVKTNCPTILHDQTAHIAGILYTFKGDDTLPGLDWSNGVVTCVAGTRDEYTCAANEGGGQHPLHHILHCFNHISFDFLQYYNRYHHSG